MRGKHVFTDEERVRGGFTAWLRADETYYSRIARKVGPDGKCKRTGRPQNLVGARARLAELMARGREMEIRE